MRKRYCGILAWKKLERVEDVYPSIMCLCNAVYEEYLRSRKNGADSDIDRPIPISCGLGDGKVRCVEGRIEGDNFYGAKKDDGYYHYELHYDEGPGDKAWMEERDWNYLQRIYHEGHLLELEPTADMEIVEDHKYHKEICGLLDKTRKERDFDRSHPPLTGIRDTLAKLINPAIFLSVTIVMVAVIYLYLSQHSQSSIGSSRGFFDKPPPGPNPNGGGNPVPGFNL